MLVIPTLNFIKIYNVDKMCQLGFSSLPLADLVRVGKLY